MTITNELEFITSILFRLKKYSKIYLNQLRKIHLCSGIYSKRNLTDVFNTYDCRNRRNVHSENQKLRILNRKINKELLQDTEASIILKLANTLVIINYDDALNLFRNQVNQKVPSKLSTSKKIEQGELMELFPKTMAEVVAFTAKAEDTTAEEADAVEEEGMMTAVDAEAYITEAVGIIQIKDGGDHM